MPTWVQSVRHRVISKRFDLKPPRLYIQAQTGARLELLGIKIISNSIAFLLAYLLSEN